MGLLGDMYKGILECKLGRIRTLSNMWTIPGGRWDKKRLETPNGQPLFAKDDRGVLVKRLCVINCPQPPVVDCWSRETKSGLRFNVPLTECKKCHFYIQGGSRRAKFACCGKLRAENPRSSAENELATMVRTATKQAEEIMRGN